jgi:hypothetical protein
MATSMWNWMKWAISRTPEGKRRRSAKRGKPGRAPEPAVGPLQVEQLEKRDRLQGGTWAPIARTIPDPNGAQQEIQLSDGSIMVLGGANRASKNWYRLKPDAFGSYVNGTWTTLAPMGLERLFFGSAVLQDGRVMVMGGEFSGPNTDNNETNTGEIYNPVTNIWTPIASFPQATFGDGNLVTLPNGDVLGSWLDGPQTYIYHPKTNTWTFAANRLNGDTSAEETWCRLPDGSILSYEIQGSAPQTAQRYVPSLNQWVFAGKVPVPLDSNGGNSGIVPEEGPALMLPDGRAFFIGASNHTAIYTPAGTPLGVGTWVAGPNMPSGFGAFDAPAAELPNGHVIIVTGPIDGNNFPPPTQIVEYDPTTNTMSIVATPPPLSTDLTNQAPFTKNVMILPSGQMILSLNDPGGTGGVDRRLWTFAGNGGPQNAWRPIIDSIVNNGNGTFTLTGRKLNGVSDGSAFGDDYQNATSFPLVRIVDSAGHIFYARTFNWSSTGVQTGNQTETVSFVLPPGIGQGATTFFVVASGIPSLPFVVNPVQVYYPFRWVYDPRTNTFNGNLTLVDNSILPFSGTIKILLPANPPGVTLANPTGFLNGIPFIQVSVTLVPHGPPARVAISLFDPRRVPLSEFFIGFPLQLILGS